MTEPVSITHTGFASRVRLPHHRFSKCYPTDPEGPPLLSDPISHDSTRILWAYFIILTVMLAQKAWGKVAAPSLPPSRNHIALVSLYQALQQTSFTEECPWRSHALVFSRPDLTVHGSSCTENTAALWEKLLCICPVRDTGSWTWKQWLFRSGYMADVFLKRNEATLFIQGKQFIVVEVNDKIQAKSKILENVYLSPRASQFPK